MYSEISACPCHPLSREDHEPPPSSLQLYHPSLKPSPEAISAALPLLPYYLSTLFLIVTLAATTLLYSNALAHSHIHFGRLLSLAFVISSLERLTNLGELERETESGSCLIGL